MQDEWLTVKQACAEIGGAGKPINVATYYRGVQAGRYPATEHPSPGIARVRRSKLHEAIEAQCASNKEAR